jgi:Zinc dependent phospholipase C
MLRRTLAVLIASLILFPRSAPAYSVLTHEAIIDVVWNSNVRPLLLKRFPKSTKEDLVKAHAYAYGGAIVQDMGYYPSGSKLLSGLTHYFRSGDFIAALLRESSDLNEYAFALGALSHYAADNEGHPLATNLVVPMLYPELAKRFGNVMTYEDNPLAHIKTEFAFDVLQVAKGRYAPDSYHDFIGFEVSLPLLERAFRDTYGIDLKTIVKDEARSANSYRYSISTLIPKATRVAWDLKKNDIQRDLPGTTRNKFLYNIRRSSYEKQWGKDYTRPTFGDRLLAFVIRIVPKIGPLRILTFRTPTPAAEKLFENSFNQSVERYRQLLVQASKAHLDVQNDNFDVGTVSPIGAYKLKDKTCAELLRRLSDGQVTEIDPNLKMQLLQFYADRDTLVTFRRHKKSAVRIDAELKTLQSLPDRSSQSAQLPETPAGASLFGH